MSIKKIELLAPAKNLECGIAAIDCGADALYIGAPKFGARIAAGNSIDDIQKLCEYAHRFWCRVYVAINTIIYDNEWREAEDLICRLCEAGADAIIIQDMSIFKMQIPPVPIFASTQAHNYSLERIKFLDAAGVSRIILARELSIDEIKTIRAVTKAELEFFVHGALCVSFSGQCYISHHSTGRSANRGECSQSCRLLYTLEDGNGNIIIKDKYLLSLKDLNLSESLEELIEAGITSFKIEGRLKEIDYVKNVTAYYRKKLNAIIAKKKGYRKCSSGTSIIGFEPDTEKSFNRGFTNYFLYGRKGKISSYYSPKSVGKFIGKVTKTGNGFFDIESREKIINGDGLCYLDECGILRGMNVSKIERNRIFTRNLEVIKTGTKIFRNYDHAFYKLVTTDKSRRLIDCRFSISNTDDGILFELIDEDENSVWLPLDWPIEPAKDNLKAKDTFDRQLKKTGDSIFRVLKVEINLRTMLFLTVAAINGIRRKLFELLLIERDKNRPHLQRSESSKMLTYPAAKLDYRANVVNKLAAKFYRESGVEIIEPGFELLAEASGLEVMRMKYCIKEELNICPKQNKTNTHYTEPLYLKSFARKYRLVFDCLRCEMGVVAEEK